VALSFLYRLLRSLIELARVHRMDAIDKDRRDPRSPSAAGCPSPSDRPAPLVLVGPSTHCFIGKTGAARKVGVVPRHTRDDPPVAPGPCPATLDLSPSSRETLAA
jgi:hypothetical protein